jgi:hypothetical protein
VTLAIVTLTPRPDILHAPWALAGTVEVTSTAPGSGNTFAGQVRAPQVTCSGKTRDPVTFSELSRASAYLPAELDLSLIGLLGTWFLPQQELLMPGLEQSGPYVICTTCADSNMVILQVVVQTTQC